MREIQQAVAWSIIGMVALVGCNPQNPPPTVTTAPSQFAVTIEGISYPSWERALEATRLKVDAEVERVPLASVRLGGRGLVVMPTRVPMELDSERTLPKGTPQVRSMLTDINEVQILATSRAVAKSKLFDSMSVVRSDNAASVPMEDADYKLSLAKFANGGAQWRLVKADGKGIDLPPPPAAVNRPAWWNGLNILITNAAADLGVSVARRPVPESVTKVAVPGGSQPAATSGTGFFISRDGYVLTNAHVVNGCKTLKLQRGGDVPVDAVTVAQDNTNDLAVLKTPVSPATFAHFSTVPARQGQDVVVYGFPLAGMLAPQGNLSTGVISAVAGLANDTRQLQISAPVQPGNSGGPLLDGSGNVIGVIVSKMNALNVAKITGDIPQNINFAIKASAALEFLQSNGVATDTQAARKTLPTADIADHAKAFTVMLTCQK